MELLHPFQSPVAFFFVGKKNEARLGMPVNNVKGKLAFAKPIFRFPVLSSLPGDILPCLS